MPTVTLKFNIMKTITITINISEEIQTPLTIKSSIQEQIDFHLKEKEKARKTRITLDKVVISLRDKILIELNEKVGSEVWFSKQTQEGYHYDTLWFRNGVIKNTSYDDWNIIIKYDKKEVVFGQIQYEVPIVENGLKIYLEPSRENFINRHLDKKVYKITDLDAVHRILEKDYLTYFTSKF